MHEEHVSLHPEIARQLLEVEETLHIPREDLLRMFIIQGLRRLLANAEPDDENPFDDSGWKD